MGDRTEVPSGPGSVLGRTIPGHGTVDRQVTVWHELSTVYLSLTPNDHDENKGLDPVFSGFPRQVRTPLVLPSRRIVTQSGKCPMGPDGLALLTVLSPSCVYSVGCCCRRFAQYRFIRSDTSWRSFAPIDFLPRRFPPRGKRRALPPARCSSSSEAITRSSFSFSAYRS